MVNAGKTGMKSQNQISMQRLSNLLNRKVVAIDGEIGPAVDFLFHDGLWVVPYIVVKTGNWLTGKKVLITPHVLQRHWTRQDIDSLPVSITKEEVKNAPLLDQHAPVSQKYVHKLTQYFQWPMYWPYGPVGEAIAPGSGISNAEGPEKSLKEKSVEYAEATPIRSFKEVSGYECGCSDGSV